jgi:hypothetical protein
LLQLYIYLVSLLGATGVGEKTTRNPLLLNQSDDILKDTAFPADWWREEKKRGCTHEDDGHWGPPSGGH